MTRDPRIDGRAPERSSAGERTLESTAVLLDRYADGDRAALDELYARYLRPLQAWARGRLPRWARDNVDTDEIVQETMLRTVRRVEVFEPEKTGAFQAYLRRGVKNQIVDEIRRILRRPRRGGTVGDAVDLAPSPIEAAIGSESLERYERALASLTSVEQAAVVARVELGLPFAKIAADLGKPSADAARMTVKRAIVRLAKELAVDG